LRLGFGVAKTGALLFVVIVSAAKRMTVVSRSQGSGSFGMYVYTNTRADLSKDLCMTVSERRYSSWSAVKLCLLFSVLIV